MFDLKRQRAGEQGSHKNAALLPTDYTLRRLGGSGDIAWLLLLPDVSFSPRGGGDGGGGAGGCVRLRDLRGPSRQFSHCYRVDRRRRDRNETNIPGHYHPSRAQSESTKIRVQCGSCQTGSVVVTTLVADRPQYVRYGRGELCIMIWFRFNASCREDIYHGPLSPRQRIALR